MMLAYAVGSLLRQRREELGIPLDLAAGATNIRARLLATIEQSDFAGYPPAGHARTMIASYARYLKMDPHPIVQAFDEEYEAFLAGREMSASAERAKRGLGRFGESTSAQDRPLTRQGSPKANSIVERLCRRKDEASDVAVSSEMERKIEHERAAEDDRYVSGSVRIVGSRSTRRPASARPGSYAKERAMRGRLSNMDVFSHATYRAGSRTYRFGEHVSRTQDAYRQDTTPRTIDAQVQRRSDAGAGAGAEAGAEHRRRGDAKSLSFFGGLAVDSVEQASDEHQRPTRSYRLHKTPVRQGSEEGLFAKALNAVVSVLSDARTRTIAVACAVGLVCIIVAVVILVATAGSGSSGTIVVEGGAQDSSLTVSDPSSATTTVNVTNGNPVKVRIEVAEGQTSLIQVSYDADQAYSGTAVGPWSREFSVSESLSATFGTSDAVSVTENGNPVEVAENEDGSGSFFLNVVSTASTSP